jgi:tetratricopeptide (TPR) repeat protein
MNRPRSKKPVTPPTDGSVAPVADAGLVRTTKDQRELPPRYLEACRLADEGKYEDARRAYAKLKQSTTRSNAWLRGLIRNDLAVLAAIEGKFDEARTGWQEAVEADPERLLARLNRDLVEAEIQLATFQDDFGELKLAPAPPSPLVGEGGPKGRMGGTIAPGTALTTETQRWRASPPQRLPSPPPPP